MGRNFNSHYLSQKGNTRLSSDVTVWKESNSIGKRYFTLNANVVEVWRDFLNSTRLFSQTVISFKAHITLKDDVAPIFHKARPVPYSLREKVDKELDKQVEAGILKKVERSEWASPVVIVPKPDGSVRICSDYKVSINKVVEDTPYPLPTADDIFSTLAGGQAFTKIDLSNAFNQLKVDECSSKYLTINTTKGMFQPTRLPYGIKTAPLMFQM